MKPSKKYQLVLFIMLVAFASSGSASDSAREELQKRMQKLREMGTQQEGREFSEAQKQQFSSAIRELRRQLAVLREQDSNRPRQIHKVPAHKFSDEIPEASRVYLKAQHRFLRARNSYLNSLGELTEKQRRTALKNWQQREQVVRARAELKGLRIAMQEERESLGLLQPPKDPESVKRRLAMHRLVASLRIELQSATADEHAALMEYFHSERRRIYGENPN